jgi:hypothetical protein
MNIEIFNMDVRSFKLDKPGNYFFFIYNSFEYYIFEEFIATNKKILNNSQYILALSNDVWISDVYINMAVSELYRDPLNNISITIFK